MPDYPTPGGDIWEKRTKKGQPNGYASLGPDGLVPSTQIAGGGGGGGGGTPSGSVATHFAAGQPATAGVSTLYSRGDHEHGSPIPVQSSTAPAVINGGAIVTGALTVSRVAPTSAVTGVILASGTQGGQPIDVINESAFSLTFAAAATSHVATGVSCVIAANTSLHFVWSNGTNLWYPAGGAGAGGGGGATAAQYDIAVYDSAVYG